MLANYEEIRKGIIYHHLHNHYEKVEKYLEELEKDSGVEYNLISVSLIGSQNYNLDTFESDVDSIAFVRPSLEALLFKKELLSKELHIENEHCVVKDIRCLYQELKKGSPNMIEAIMTDFYLDGWGFQSVMEDIRGREDFARINPNATINALCGLGLSSTHKNYHAERALEMVKRYSNGERYKEILVSQNLENLKEKKNKNSPTDSEVLEELNKILTAKKKCEVNTIFLKKLEFCIKAFYSSPYIFF